MNIKNKIIIISAFISLSGCSSLVPTGAETAFKYLGIAKGVGDVASYSKTGKTLNDHFLSAAIGKDCKLGRIITKKPIFVWSSIVFGFALGAIRMMEGGHYLSDVVMAAIIIYLACFFESKYFNKKNV